MEFSNLKQLMQKFKDEETCRKYLIDKMHNGQMKCPKCANTKLYNIEGGKRYKCANNQCYHKFSVTVGTFCENTNIPLSTWFPAIYLIASHKQGITSVQLAKDLGITQKSAWFLLHRIRMALKENNSPLLGGIDGSGIVEADESLVGGSVSNKHNKKRAEWVANGKDNPEGKETVFTMVERNGMVVTKHVQAATKEQINPLIKERLHPNAVLVTDTSHIYKKLGSLYSHFTLNHRENEYVRDSWYTNTVEGYFSQLKRTLYGNYICVSPKHLQAYCDEVSLRYNTRDMKDPQRFDKVLGNFAGRLRYTDLLSRQWLKAPKKEKAIKEPKEAGLKRNRKPIVQMLEGVIINEFESIKDAALKTGYAISSIHAAASGKQPRSHNYQWVFKKEELNLDNGKSNKESTTEKSYSQKSI